MYCGCLCNLTAVSTSKRTGGLRGGRLVIMYPTIIPTTRQVGGRIQNSRERRPRCLYGVGIGETTGAYARRLRLRMHPAGLAQSLVYDESMTSAVVVTSDESHIMSTVYYET
eukprot:8921901-Pyramimonas_sp.AAC.1